MDKKTGLVVGIDIGTGSTKAVIMNKAGNIIGSCQNIYPIQITEETRNPEIILNSFFSCLQEALSKIDFKAETICLSSCMHSLMLIDEDDAPLTDVITWADSRAGTIAATLRKDCGEILYNETGTPVHAMSPLCKILWFKQNQPDLFQRAKKFIGIKEYIWHKLFNTYEIDYSVASATGLFSSLSLQWNSFSLQLTGLSPQSLSKIVPPDHSLIYNTNTTELSFLKGQSFMIGASDGCLANIGSGTFYNDNAAITIGTSGAVRTTTSRPICNYKNMIFNYVLEKDIYISGGPVNNGGNILKWLFQTYMQVEEPSHENYTALFKSVEKIPAGSEGLMFLPYIHGERAPVWDEFAAGAFIGIKSHHTTAHFIRAGLEGICYGLSSILNILSENQPISKVNVSGGFINSTVWTQILTDIISKEVFVLSPEDSAAIGAAMLALKANKYIINYNQLLKPPVKIFKPIQSNVEIYQQYSHVFSQLYPSIQPLSSAINLINIKPIK